MRYLAQAGLNGGRNQTGIQRNQNGWALVSLPPITALFCLANPCRNQPFLAKRSRPSRVTRPGDGEAAAPRTRIFWRSQHTPMGGWGEGGGTLPLLPCQPWTSPPGRGPTPGGLAAPGRWAGGPLGVGGGERTELKRGGGGMAVGTWATLLSRRVCQHIVKIFAFKTIRQLIYFVDHLLI